MSRGRARRGLVAVGCALTLLLIAPACSSRPKVQAGNLQEKRQKRRELEEAQRRALEEQQRKTEAAPAEVPAGEKPAEAAAAAPSAAAEPAAGEPVASPGLPRGIVRVTLAGKGDSTETLLLAGPRIGHFVRTHFSGGGVVDREKLASDFTFHEGTDFITLKFKRLDRVEFLKGEGSRTDVRLRFHFRKPQKKPRELPADDLLGAEHPQPPFLEGTGPDGVVRLPLFPPIEDEGYRQVLDIDFTPAP